MTKNIEGSFENPILVKSFQSLHSLDYLKFVNIDGRKELKCTNQQLENVITISEDGKTPGRVSLHFYDFLNELEIVAKETYLINSDYLEKHYGFGEARDLLKLNLKK
jgi:hypothetical protein